MNITSEIYRNTIKYLNNEIHLSDLENWVVSHLGTLLLLPEGPERDLVGEMELGLSEMTNGHLDEYEFRKTILRLVETSKAEILPSLFSAQTSAELIELDVATPDDSTITVYDIVAV